VLKRGWSIVETSYPKKERHLPGILSQEEVARLIEAADKPFHHIGRVYNDIVSVGLSKNGSIWSQWPKALLGFVQITRCTRSQSFRRHPSAQKMFKRAQSLLL
jgi:hypothetical protein